MKHFQMTNPEGSEIVNLTAPSGSPYPLAPNIAELFYKTGSLRLEVHNGTSWDTLALQADVDAVTAALAGYLPLTGGTLNGSLSMNSGSPQTRILLSSGTTALPSISFTGDPDTGLYQAAAGRLDFTVNATTKLSILGAVVTSTVPFTVASGSSTAPSFAFTSDTDCGMYRSNTNEISFATDAIQRFRIEADGTLSVVSNGSPPYEAFVTADDDIPNKKYVDDVVSGSGHLSNVIEDTSPQLGANLDVNGFDINTTTNSIIDITGYFNTGGAGGGVAVTGGASTTSTGGSASVAGGQGTTGAAAVLRGGTGTSASGGQAQIAGGNGPTGGGRVRIQVGRDTTDGSFDGWLDFEKPSGLTAPVFRFHEAGSRGTRYVALKAPDAMTGSPSVTARTWVLPSDDPAVVAGEFLTTDASGNLSFDAVPPNTRITDSGGSPVDEETFVDTTEVADTITTNVPASGTYESVEPFRASAAGGTDIKASDAKIGGGAGGHISITAGEASNVGGGDGGTVTITAGRNTAGTTPGTTAGAINLVCSAASLGTTAGTINLTSGEGTTDGGNINITTGGGNGTGDGGDIAITTGDGSGTRYGGNITIRTGDGGPTNADGGALWLQPGGASGAGTQYGVGIRGPNGTATVAGELRIYDTEFTSADYIGLTVPDNALSASITYTLPELPTGSPFPSQFLTTDASGVMSWGDVPTPATTLGGLTDVTIDGSPAPQINDILVYVDGSPPTWTHRPGLGATANEFRFTAAGSPPQTVFSGTDDLGRNLTYNPGDQLVYLNGTLLVAGTDGSPIDQDYVALDGTSITLATGAAAGNILQVFEWGSFNIGATQDYLTIYKYTIDGSPLTTTLSGADDNANVLAYAVGEIQVFLNGVLQEEGTDYTASNGTSVVLLFSPNAADVIQITAFDTFRVANHYTKSEINNKYDTFSIQFTLPVAGNDTYPMQQRAQYGFTIDQAYFQTASGTIDGDVQIGGVSVTGLDAMSVSSTEGSATATANQSVGTGDKVTLVTTNNSSANMLSVILYCTRT